MRANSEAAKKHLARLNNEYLIRRLAEKRSRPPAKANVESFSEAVARIAKEADIAL